MHCTTLRPTRRHHRLATLLLALACALPATAEPGSSSSGSHSRSARSGSGSSGSGSQRERKISRRVRSEVEGRKRRKAGASAPLNVIVRFRQAPGNAERSLVRSFGGKTQGRIRTRWMATALTASAIEALADSDAVEYVASDAPLQVAMDTARAAAGLPGPEQPESALKGNGVTIAMIDSGVAPHAEIQSLVAAVDLLAPGSSLNPSESVDLNGHGTHVAGILVGNGSRSANGRLAGIAPEAQLISLRVLDGNGAGRTSDMLAALDWIHAHKDEYGIRVLNLSLGHPVYEPADQDPLVGAVEDLWDAGIVVVCSAGNLGREGHGTVTSPCNARNVISVGAINDRNTPNPNDDTVATYSSRGPTYLDGVAKPDLLAPGNRVVSVRAPGSHLDLEFPERRKAGNGAQPQAVEHYEMSGTSMAAPVVAGAAALMIQQDPTLNPATVKARLMKSARKADVGDPFATGAGVVDILAALHATGEVAVAPSPRVTPAGSNSLAIEDTGVLWANPEFSLQSLWSETIVWSSEQPLDGVLRSEAVLWPETAAYAMLWPEAALWPEAMLWPESTLWSESVLWSDEPIDVVGSLGQPVCDP